MSNDEEDPVDGVGLTAEDMAVDLAVRESVRDALRQHKRAGNSIVVWRDGKIVDVPASEIVVDDD